MKVDYVTDVKTLSSLSPLIVDYTKQLHSTKPMEAASMLLDEMARFIDNNDNVIMKLDQPDGNVVGFVYATKIDNYGDRIMFIVAIYSIIAGGGRELFDAVCDVAKGRGCRKVTGLVEWKRWQGHAAVWKAEPTKAWLERVL